MSLIYILKRPLVMHAGCTEKLSMTPTKRFVCILQNYKVAWNYYTSNSATDK